MNKKIIAIMAAFAFLLTTVACDAEKNIDQRPAYYPNSIWVCDEYGISFKVDENGETEGKIITDGRETSFTFLYPAFDGRGINFITNLTIDTRADGQVMSYDYLFGGTTKLTKDRCEITITDDSIGR